MAISRLPKPTEITAELARLAQEEAGRLAAASGRSERKRAAARVVDRVLRFSGHQPSTDLRVTIRTEPRSGPWVEVAGGHLHRAWSAQDGFRARDFEEWDGERDPALSGVLQGVVDRATDPSGWLERPGTSGWAQSEPQVYDDLARANRRESANWPGDALADLQRRYGDGPGLPKFASGGVIGPVRMRDTRTGEVEAYAPLQPATDADWSGYSRPTVPQEEVDRRVSLAIRHLAAALGASPDEIVALTITPVAVTATVLEPGGTGDITMNTRRGATYTYRPNGRKQKEQGDE